MKSQLHPLRLAPAATCVVTPSTVTVTAPPLTALTANRPSAVVSTIALAPTGTVTVTNPPGNATATGPTVMSSTLTLPHVTVTEPPRGSSSSYPCAHADTTAPASPAVSRTPVGSDTSTTDTSDPLSTPPDVVLPSPVSSVKAPAGLVPVPPSRSTSSTTPSASASGRRSSFSATSRVKFGRPTVRVPSVTTPNDVLLTPPDVHVSYTWIR